MPGKGQRKPTFLQGHWRSPSVEVPGGSSSLPAFFWGLPSTSFLDSNAKASETFPMLHNFFSPCIIFLILSLPFFFTCWVEGLSLIVTVPVGSEVPTKESLCAHRFDPDWWPVCQTSSALPTGQAPGSCCPSPISHCLLPLAALPTSLPRSHLGGALNQSGLVPFRVGPSSLGSLDSPYPHL